MAVLTRRASDVRINEVDLSSSLAGASSTTAAIAVVSSQGPVEPTFYSNPDDFIFDFGNPNAAVSFDHYGVADFFKEGNSLWAARSVGTGAKYAALIAKLDTSLDTQVAGISAGIVDPSNPDWDTLVSAGETPLFLFSAKRGQGSYANSLAIKIESENLEAPKNPSATSSSTGGNLLAATFEYYVAAISKTGETLCTAPISIVIGSLTTTNSVTIHWDAVPGAVGYYIYGRSPGTPGRIAQVGGGTTSYVDTGIVTPDLAKTPITNPADLPAPSQIFTVKIYNTAVNTSVPVETFTCSMTEQTDDTGAQMEITQRINPFSRYVKVQSNLTGLLTTPVMRTTGIANLAGGASGTAPTAADINNTWKKFSDKENYRLDVLINGGRVSVAVQQYMDGLATSRNDCIAILDAPSYAQDAQDVVDYRNLQLNLNSSYSALVTSDLLETDPIDGKLIYIPPSGMVAGLIARTARVGQPWFSCAGLNRGLVRVNDLRLKFDDGAAGLLYTNNISYFRKFSGRGIAFWEQNTLLNKSSALQFINVRILCNIIKRAAYDFLLYGLQEPNDDILRKQLEFGLNEYLITVKAGRGISNYRIVIDDSNNPAALVNSGVLAVAVIITPILAVREVQLTLALSKQGIEVSEAEISSF